MHPVVLPQYTNALLERLHGASPSITFILPTTYPFQFGAEISGLLLPKDLPHVLRLQSLLASPGLAVALPCSRASPWLFDKIKMMSTSSYHQLQIVAGISCFALGVPPFLLGSTPPPHKNNKNTNQENNCTAYCAHHVRVKEHGEEKRRRRKKEEKRRKREGDFIKHFPFPAYCTYPFFSIASIRNRSRSFFA